MANTTNYNWETPDDTDLVKDGAAAIRTLGSSIDTTTKALNPSTTLGDIEYRSATANTNTRLAIGTTGQVLTVAGGVPTWATSDDANAIQNALLTTTGDTIYASGASTPARLGIGSTGQVLTVAGGLPSWATPAAGGGANWSLLNAGGTALTGATTITVSGISDKDKILVLVESASTGAASDFIAVRFNGDSATNYKYITAEYQWASTYAAANFSGASAIGGNDGINLARMSASAGSIVQGYVLLTGGNSSGVKAFQGAGNASPDGSSGHRSYFPNGVYDSSSTISSVSVVSSGSNFDGSGKVYVYTSA